MLWGGEYPGHILIERFYIAHVLLLPGLLLALIGAHLALVVRQRHTRPPGTEQRSQRAFPVYVAGAGARFFIVSSVLVGLGGLAQINPVWLYGPYQPTVVSSNSHPDWYMFFLEGSLRLFPGWEFRGFGHTVPAVFWPGAVLPTVMFLVSLTYPFIEARLSGDRRSHDAAQGPREAPIRSAVGTAAVTGYLVLAFSAAQDIYTKDFNLQIEAVVWTERIAALVLPAISAVITYRVCRGRLERPPRCAIGSDVFERAADGEYRAVETRTKQPAGSPDR
jgi:ubiquinol-cytochrome c reductase cytochrome b subunit